MNKRFIFIALDAADFDLIQCWAQSGELPAFAHLLKHHRFVQIKNDPGLYVGSVWPTISTGTSPDWHGRYCWWQLRAGTYEDEFIQADQIKGDRIWNQLDRLGYAVCVIDIPKSLPSSTFRGRFVKDWGTHDPSAGGFRIFGWMSTDEFVRKYGSDKVGRCDAIKRTSEGFALFRDQLIQRAEARTKVICDVLSEQLHDVIMASFSEAHCVGHQCWHIHDNSHDLHDENIRKQIGDPILNVYKVLDSSIEKILSHTMPNDTIMILATHGMGTNYNASELLNEIIVDIEFETLTLSQRRELQILGIPRLLSFDCQYFRRMFKIFPIANNSAYAAFRLNIIGREPEGKLTSEEATEFIHQFHRKIMTLKNGETGESLFTSTVFRNDTYFGPVSENLPDLMLEWNRCSPIRLVRTQRSILNNSYGNNPRTGDHKANGAMFLIGKGVDALQLGNNISTTDLASIILCRH